jgi:hypothetical protein
LQKIVDTLIAYALTFKKIVDFVESWNRPSYFGSVFRIIMQVALEFIFICP